MGDAYSGQRKRKGEDISRKAVKKKWRPEEDEVLIASLSELCKIGWKRENGMFKNGYTAALERKLRSSIPGCTIMASPHIESRLKLLKRQYDAITEMQGAAGMHWDNEEKIMLCKDSNVWEEWVQNRPDAKGLRNKHFPYYDDLHFLLANRGTKKGLNNDELDDDNNSIPNLMEDDSFEEEDRGNNEVFQNGSFQKDANNNGANISLIEHFKKREACRDVTWDASKCDASPDHEGTNGQSEDSGDAIVMAETVKKKSFISDGELGELAKIFGGFLEKYQEHISLLGEIIGKEASADTETRACEKRARLNGELSKLPNLNLQARLRAATFIATDAAKPDLFYSFSEEERIEWVSMLLSGLL